jgi:hypothetical protein
LLSNANSKEYLMRYYLVAFLDILGQREKLRKITLLPRSEEDFQKVRETMGTVLTFRELFAKFLEGFKRKRGLPHDLSPAQEISLDDLKKRAEEVQPKIQSVSDTIIIYVPLSDENKIVHLDGMLPTLLAIAACFLSLMAKGSLFRGGIDIGIGVEIDDRDIYGPALVSAYDLESKVAKYPRIVMGDKFVEFLYSNIQKPETDAQSQINRQLAMFCRDLLLIDGDGRFILDYLGEKYRDMAKQILTFDLPSKAKAFFEREMEKVKDDKDSKLYIYYNCLAVYFEEKLHLWEKGEDR